MTVRVRPAPPPGDDNTVTVVNEHTEGVHAHVPAITLIRLQSVNKSTPVSVTEVLLSAEKDVYCDSARALGALYDIVVVVMPEALTSWTPFKYTRQYRSAPTPGAVKHCMTVALSTEQFCKGRGAAHAKGERGGMGGRKEGGVLYRCGIRQAESRVGIGGVRSVIVKEVVPKDGDVVPA